MRRQPLATVTGATGFLGRHVCEWLQATGWLVRGVGRREQPPEVVDEYVQADLRDGDAVVPAVTGAAVVVNCAALAHRHCGDATAEDYHTSNVHAALQLARAAADSGVGRFLQVSSSSVYGPRISGASENEAIRPATPYGRSKALAEELVAEHCRQAGVALTIVRPATLYGVGDPGNVRRLIEAILAGSFVQVGRGENQKSLTLVNDCARAIGRIATEEPSSSSLEVFNVSAPPTAMASVVRGIAGRNSLASLPPVVPAGPTLAALGYASLACARRGPVHRLYESVQKWLSDDTIDASRFDRRFPNHAWEPFQRGVAAEVAWLAGAHSNHLRAA